METLKDDVVNTPTTKSQASKVAEEKSQMLRVANVAMQELLFLLNTSEPFWTKPSNDVVGFVLVRERYEKKFPRVIDPKYLYTCEESSKDSLLVMASGMELVKVFLDSDEWADHFPTIVSKAKTIQEFDVGSLENHSTGALQLMSQEVHVLSPLVPSREYFFLRYCQQVEAGEWLIVDVSLDSFENCATHSVIKKLPSGCRVRELPNGCSMVTWIEHVEVGQRFQLDMLVRDIVRNNIAYGAKRWLLELQRTFDKKFCYAFGYVPSTEGLEGEVKSMDGRESVINLSNGMVGDFCKVLNTQGMQNLLDLSNELTTSIKIIAHECTILDDMIIVTSISSIWLPVKTKNVLLFLRDEFRSDEWYVLSVGRPMRKKAHIPINGSNDISIFETNSTIEDNCSMIFQESSIDYLGGYVVYAPLSEPYVRMIVNGGDSSDIVTLPSGFTVSRDSREVNEGSLLTMCYQFRISQEGPNFQLSPETHVHINSVFMSAFGNIMDAFNCSHD